VEVHNGLSIKGDLKGKFLPFFSHFNHKLYIKLLITGLFHVLIHDVGLTKLQSTAIV